jgi:hypothetical protein
MMNNAGDIVQPGDGPGDLTGRARISGLFRPDLNSLDPFTLQFAANLQLDQVLLLVVEGANGEYLDVFACESLVPDDQVSRLLPVPGQPGIFQLPEGQTIVGLENVTASISTGLLEVTVSNDLLFGGAVILPLRPEELPDTGDQSESGSIFRVTLPGSPESETSAAVCGEFGQQNARVGSASFGAFHFAADQHIHRMDVMLPSGLQESLSDEELMVILRGSWYEMAGNASPRPLGSPSFLLNACEINQFIDMTVSGVLAEGDWQLRLRHFAQTGFVCPDDQPPGSPTPDEQPPVGEDPEPVDPVDEELPEENQDPINEESQAPIDEDTEEPVIEEPAIEEPLEEPAPPSDLPTEENLPPPVGDNTPVNPDPAPAMEAECLPEQENFADTLTGRWTLENRESLIALLGGNVSPVVLNRLQSNFFIADNDAQSKVVMAFCEEPDLRFDFVRNGTELISDDVNSIFGLPEEFSIESVTQENSDAITFSAGSFGQGLVRQTSSLDNVCWYSDQAAPMPSSSRVCSALQPDGFRLVFQVNNELVTLDFLLGLVPEVDVYQLSDQQPAIVTSDMFLASGREASQEVTEGMLEIKSIGSRLIRGSFRLVLPSGETVSGSFSSDVSRLPLNQ